MIKFLKNQKGQKAGGTFLGNLHFFGDKKGQAFSVFKILIAAIVALAILMLLLNIMGMINFNPANKPDSAAKDMVKTAYSNEYQLQSKVVTFNKDSKTIIPAHITASGGAAIDNEQVCFEQPVSAINGFEIQSGCGTNGQILYGGNTDREVTLYAICGSDAQSIGQGSGGVVNPSGYGSGETFCYLTIGSKK